MGSCRGPTGAGDEDGWLALLLAAGFEEWDRPRVDEYLTDPERREGSSVIVEGDTMVAATFATRIYRDGVELALLDYVISSPDRRRLGLGRAVCTAVARFHVERGYPAVSLFTDDWRLPAIGLYLSLGFEPDMHREDMPGRWDAIRAKLASAGDEGLPAVHRRIPGGCSGLVRARAFLDTTRKRRRYSG